MQGIDDILGLQTFRFKKTIAAEEGIGGGRQNLFGRNGKDAIVQIPIGTLVTDTKTGEAWEIADATTKILIARGGIGGKGNTEFKSATNQTPWYAEKGTPGEVKEIHLELRIIADVGLIGLPNAGKSSLLQMLTNAHPKIGNYPFTTLEPNIGMMSDIALADIPGLIEGASRGKGLGTEFLRHVQKTKLLLHCIDSTQDDVADVYQTVRKELEAYDPVMLEKKEIVLLTKTDLVDTKEVAKKMKQLQKYNKHILSVSMYDTESVDKLVTILKKEIHNGK